MCLCPLLALFRHSFEYLVNFRSTIPSLSTALCLSQLLSTMSEKGGNPAAYREQTGQCDAFPHLHWLTYYPVCDCDDDWLIFLPSFPGETFPEPRVGDSQRREGAREQIQ